MSKNRRTKSKCSFPGCNHYGYNQQHHIVPLELRPRNNKVTVPLCPTCHTKIFHPKSTKGMHSILTEESLEILNTFKTNNGQAIQYRSPITYESFYYMPQDGTFIPAEETPA